ncbi:AraC-like DNA-binding protein [Pseudomonas duriflava]|uniref:AraC-like DNA-binding protein n=1 Tax=Pseudomonas duriflava TaxID=459528 RepID=A0A562Q726_9PSED|nr:AraC family transcriptional regulator [Pseudomonas duriflava]TWI52533.1 AraC-like DNA-binding protein [Pseudomonas duriflava]
MIWYERDQRCIPAHHQPACLIDLALSRGIEQHRLMRGTGLFYDDVLAGQTRISPEHFLRLLQNAEHLLSAPDTSFLLGQRLLPGHYGAASLALSHAANLQEALDLLVRHRASLSPLFAPRLVHDEQYLCLYWIDSCGAGTTRRFMAETCQTTVAAMCRWLSGEHLPWHFLFSHAQPSYLEQYQAHLGNQLHFNAQIDAMIIAREYLIKPWPRAQSTAGRIAQRDALTEQASQAMEQGFLEHIYALLQADARQPASLESLAVQLGISPSTLKRKLHKHGTHFQAVYDQVRKHVALYLYWSRGLTNEEVADYLGFHDTTNFRRAFKRWTGCVPSILKPLA